MRLREPDGGAGRLAVRLTAHRSSDAATRPVSLVAGRVAPGVPYRAESVR